MFQAQCRPPHQPHGAPRLASQTLFAVARIHQRLTVGQAGQMTSLRLKTVELPLHQTGLVLPSKAFLNLYFPLFYISQIYPSTVVGDGARYCGRFFAVDPSTVTYKAGATSTVCTAVLPFRMRVGFLKTHECWTLVQIYTFRSTSAQVRSFLPPVAPCAPPSPALGTRWMSAASSENLEMPGGHLGLTFIGGRWIVAN